MASTDDNYPPSPVNLPRVSNPKRRCRASVLFIVVITGTVSTAVSLTGGLLMYLESISSLTETVKDVSAAELGQIGSEVLVYFDRCVAVNKQLRQQFLAKTTGFMRLRGAELGGSTATTGAEGRRVVVSNEMAQYWENATFETFMGIMSSHRNELYDTGVILIPYEFKDPAYFYSHVWKDELANGSRQIVWGTYSYARKDTHYINNSAAEPSQKARGFLIDPDGTERGVAYDFDWAYYWHHQLPDGVEVSLNSLPLGWKFLQDELGYGYERWRPPHSWDSVDGTATIYTAYEVILPAPPPPHPWSGYKGVSFATMFIFKEWQGLLEAYSKENPDSTIVVYDTLWDWVYAATTSLVGLRCTTGRNVATLPDTCQTRMDSMDKAISDCYDAIYEQKDSFTVAQCDGSKHFVRLQHVFSYNPPEGGRERRLDPSLLWTQKATIVETRVTKSLVMFLCFIGVVFFFDLILGVLEAFMVAIPLRKLADAMRYIRRFELEAGNEIVQSVRGRSSIGIWEVDMLAQGADWMIRDLQEYKNFLPLAVLEVGFPDDHSEQSSKSERAPTPSPTTEWVSPLDEIGSFKSRKVSVAIVNARGLTSCPPAEAAAVFTNYISKILFFAKENRGVADSFVGDRVLLHWNASRVCGSHIAAGVNFVHALKSALPKLATLSLVTGETCCGVLGAHGMKRFSLLSPLGVWAYVLERLNAVYGTRSLLEAKVIEAVKCCFLYECVDVVLFKKYSQDLQLVYCLLYPSNFLINLVHTKLTSLSPHFFCMNTSGEERERDLPPRQERADPSLSPLPSPCFPPYFSFEKLESSLA